MCVRLSYVNYIYKYNAVLLEIMYAVWCCRDIVSSHVLVHLRETLLDVVLCAAFSYCSKSESLRGMVQLQERINKSRCYFTDIHIFQLNLLFLFIFSLHF